MARGTRSNRQPSRSPNRSDDDSTNSLRNLVNFKTLLEQQRALLTAVEAVPTPTSPENPFLRYRYQPIFGAFDQPLNETREAAPWVPFNAEARAAPEVVGQRASASRGPRSRSRSRSATRSHRRAPDTVGSTPTLSAHSTPAPTAAGGRFDGDFWDLPTDYFKSTSPRARAVSAVPGGDPLLEYTQTSHAYNMIPPTYSPILPQDNLISPTYDPLSPGYNPTSPTFNPYRLLSSPLRSPRAGTVIRRLDDIAETLERLQRRVDVLTDRFEAQLLAITQTLSTQTNGAVTPSSDRKRKRSVVDLTADTPSPKSPKKVDFVDLVTDTSWSGSEFSSSGSSSSSSDSLSSSSSDSGDDDGPSTPSKKPKPSPSCSPFSSPRSPKTPSNNRTPTPPRNPRKAAPSRPAPRTPTRQLAPARPSTPPAPRKTRAASRAPTPQAPRTPPQQTAPATPAAPRKNRSGTREATASPSRAPAPAPAPARQPTRASSRIRERAASPAHRPLLQKSIKGRKKSCPGPRRK
ncbi:hypothetical protein Q7P35_000727 [Cladosporium inversicolor]